MLLCDSVQRKKPQTLKSHCGLSSKTKWIFAPFSTICKNCRKELQNINLKTSCHTNQSSKNCCFTLKELTTNSLSSRSYHCRVLVFLHVSARSSIVTRKDTNLFLDKANKKRKGQQQLSVDEFASLFTSISL